MKALLKTFALLAGLGLHRHGPGDISLRASLYERFDRAKTITSQHGQAIQWANPHSDRS